MLCYNAYYKELQFLTTIVIYKYSTQSSKTQVFWKNLREIIVMP